MCGVEISLLSEHKRAGCIWQWYWIYTRKVVGWAFSSVADSQLAQNALTMAWKTGAVQKD
jgi:hypothetical protein